MQISIEIAEKFYEHGRLNEAQEVCEQIVAGDPRGVHLDSDFVVSPDMLLSLLGNSGP